MSKSITVSSVAYVHTDDVDPEKHISAIPINEAMNVAVVRAINALENPTGAYTDFQRATMQTCLRSAQSTPRGDPKGADCQVYSLMSIAQSAAELTTLYPNDMELASAVTRAWNELHNAHILANAVWNIRTKGLFGVVG